MDGKAISRLKVFVINATTMTETKKSLLLLLGATVAASAVSKDDLKSILQSRNISRDLQSSISCSRYDSAGGEATVCQDDSTLAYCFINNPDDCEYVAIDWNLFDQTKASYDGTVYGNLDLFIAETFFTCTCDSGTPNCAASTFTTHNINACQEPAEQLVTCETEDGTERCNGRVGDRNYQCTKAATTAVGVETVACCTVATATEPRTCVASTVIYDDFVNNPNPDPDLLSCAVNVDGQLCDCTICGPQTEAIGYDCTAAGRSDLIQACPSSSLQFPALQDFYNAKIDLPFFFIEPLAPLATLSPTQSPSTSQQPTMAITPPPTPPPTRAPTPPPTPAPTTAAPSSSPTLSMSPSKRPTGMPSVSPTEVPTASPTAPTPSPTDTPSAGPTLEYVANCIGIHFKLARFNEGQFGDLECTDYTGDFPGVVYTCSATTALENGVVTLKVEPEEESMLRPFQRECRSSAPNNLTFYCLDNVGANFNTYQVETAGTLLTCDNNDDEVYAYPQYNLLQGINAESPTSANFDAFFADNAFFVEFLEEDSSPTSLGGADTSTAATFTFSRWLLAATFLFLTTGVLATAV